MIKQQSKDFGFVNYVRTQLDMDCIEDTYSRRLKGEKISIPRGIDSVFLIDPQTSQEKKVATLITQWRKEEQIRLEKELFTQKQRNNGAQMALKEKITKKAENDLRISENKIWQLESKIKHMNSPKLVDRDYRFYPFSFVPFYVFENGELVEKLGRYHLRMNHFEENFDKDKQGCYNARLDNLTSFWKPVFGKKHGILVLDRFYENVQKKDYEKKNKLPNAKHHGAILELEFIPKSTRSIVVPVIYDEWKRKHSPTLLSFALITDEPPPEVKSTGHDRCPIFLNPERIKDWLSPGGKSVEELKDILSDKVKPYYEHTVVAA